MSPRWAGWSRAVVLAAGLGVAGVSVAGEVFLIDVRTAGEFSEGHLVGAININHTEIAARIDSVTQDKDAVIELYCRRGRRSGIALESLRNAGYKNVVNIGGFEDLKKTRPATQ
jgi:phage shock protein E